MEQLSEYPCTVVEAPMGYGKTTFVREAMRGTSSRVLWESVYDENTEAFWEGLCNKLSLIDGGTAEILMRIGLPTDRVLRREAVNRLSEIQIEQNTFLVIDDYHLLNSKSADDFLLELLYRLPAQLHLIVISRSAFLNSSPELQLKKLVRHIGTDQLRLTLEDINGYFNVCGIILTKTQQNMLSLRSEGWISALYLFMMEYIEKGSFNTAQNIQELVHSTVYAPLNDEQKRFLNCVVLFDSFTLKQAQYMWQNDTAEPILSELHSNNAFITKYTYSSEYHLHKIFSICVREEFAKLPEQRQMEIWHRAGLWHISQKEYLQAMDCFYQSKSFDDLLKVLEIDKGNCLTGKTMSRAIQYISDCPEEICANHHFAMLVYARKLFGVNETQMFLKICSRLTDNIPKDAKLSKYDKDNLLGEFEVLISISKYNDILKMSEHHQKAGRLLKGSTQILNTGSNWTFSSPSVLAMFHRETGRLSDELAIMKTAMPFYYQIAENQGYGAEYIMEAEADFCRGNVDRAEVALHKAVYQATLENQWSIQICTSFLQCRLAVFQGDYQTAFETMKKIRGQIAGNNIFVYYHTIDLCEAWIFALLGQPYRIAEWLADGEITNTALLFPAMPMLHMIYGRVLLERGEYKKLIGLSDLFLNTASIFPNLLCKLYIYVHQSAAYGKLFNRDKAVECLDAALKLAAPDDLFMPFAENGDSIGSILWESGRFPEYMRFIAKCRFLYETYSTAIEKIRLAYFPEQAFALTEREQEVAELAAGGMTNREIGERLFITENTVKARLKSVFEKLGIKSRAQLVEHLKENKS